MSLFDRFGPCSQAAQSCIKTGTVSTSRKTSALKVPIQPLQLITSPLFTLNCLLLIPLTGSESYSYSYPFTMYFTKSSVLSLSLLASSQLVAGHSAIVKAVGDAGGQGSAIGSTFSIPPFHPGFSILTAFQLTLTLPVTALAATPSSRTLPASEAMPQPPVARPSAEATTMSRPAPQRSCSSTAPLSPRCPPVACS